MSLAIRCLEQVSLAGSSPVSVTRAGVSNCSWSGVIYEPVPRAGGMPDTVPKAGMNHDSVPSTSASPACDQGQALISLQRPNTSANHDFKVF